MYVIFLDMVIICSPSSKEKKNTLVYVLSSAAI